eukprot:GFUD01008861.1.p1 GENE.GFUD01008861.1~~GFUD01008861.1.p1  ORF type:complete len:818 (+),score=200.97 GFUD01008861.1:105-2558(+)
MNTLEEVFLASCKTGNLDLVIECLKEGIDVNCSQGWGLRRAVRYGHSEVWQALLKSQGNKIHINLVNQFGLSALHTACRFGAVEAVGQILQNQAVLVNERTKQGSSPIMVAVKYGRKTVVEIMVKDSRVDLEVIDTSGRTLYEVIGLASETCDSVKLEIGEMIKMENNKRSLRKKKKGILEALEPGQLIVRQAREKVNKLVNDMEETQRIEMMRFQENLENNSREFHDKQQEEKENFSLKMEEEQRIFYQNQEIQKNKFQSKMERGKYVFVRMQQEAMEEFVSNEKVNLDRFKEVQAEQRQSLQLSHKGEELEMSTSQQAAESNKALIPRMLNIYPDVSDLVGRNSFSLPNCDRYCSTDAESHNACIDKAQLTQSKTILEFDKNTKLGHRKSLPVMGPTPHKEYNVDRSASGQFLPPSPVTECRKISCPANLPSTMLEPAPFFINTTTFPYTPPPSPAPVIMFYPISNDQQQMSQQCLSASGFIPIPAVHNARATSKSSFSSSVARLSPMQSFSSNTSSNPSPVPSLEYISPNEMFMSIPDTCPNIKALLTSQERYNMPLDDSELVLYSNASPEMKSPPPNRTNVPLFPAQVPETDSTSAFNNMNPVTPMQVLNSSPILAKEIKPIIAQHQLNNSGPKQTMVPENSPPVTKLNKPSLTPRLVRKNAMEVVEEEDDVEDQLITKDDEEIAELTSTGIIRNKSSTFTNLVSNMQSPSPSKSRVSTQLEDNKANNKATENKKIFFLDTENNSPDSFERYEEIAVKKERSRSLPETNIECKRIEENISKQNSGLSLASSTSTSSFKSAETSPVREFGCILV